MELKKKKKSPKKIPTLGMEFEFFLLDKNGSIVYESEKYLETIYKKNAEAKLSVYPENSTNMVELGSFPSVDGLNTLKSIVENLSLMLRTAEEMNISLCPLGTYPGKFQAHIRQTKKYKAYTKLIGPKRYVQSGMISGFHLHYALPWGTFDQKNLELKKLIRSKNKQSLVNTYNFLIAADPALATFMQSSPFYQGKYLAKDSRMLIWRTWENNEYPNGVFANFPEYAALPQYLHTITDIIYHVDTLYDNWIKLLREKAKVKESEMPEYKSKFQVNRSPVRINYHGTVEQRGMDINHLITIGSVSILVTRILRAIQYSFLEVESTDRAIRKPFTLEGKKILVPPVTYLRQELQHDSAFKGMRSERMRDYCARLIELGKIIEGKKIENFISTIEKMVVDKKTLSDEIIEQAKALGHDNLNKELPNQIACHIALDHSKRLYKELILLEGYMNEIQNG